MFLHWRANLADQNKQQPLKINIRVTYHTVLSVWNKPLIDTACQHCSTSRANQALRSLMANAGFQNRGVLSASVSFLPLPLPLLSFFGSCFISRAAKTKNPVPRSFFAPKPNGNACYAGYGNEDFMTQWIGFIYSLFVTQRSYSNYTKIPSYNKHFPFWRGRRGQAVCCNINSPLEIREKNLSKNELVRKNAVTRAHGICSLRVMGSWVVLTLHYNGITDNFPVCHLLLIILKSKFESKFK